MRTILFLTCCGTLLSACAQPAAVRVPTPVPVEVPELLREPCEAPALEAATLADLAGVLVGYEGALGACEVKRALAVEVMDQHNAAAAATN